MQSQDDLGNIVQSVPIDFGNVSDLVAKIKTAKEKGAVSHVIGDLPKNGQNVTINGLSFNVEFADYVKGKFTVKLVLRDK